MARRYTACAFVALLTLPTACIGGAGGAGSAEQYQGVLCDEDEPFCEDDGFVEDDGFIEDDSSEDGPRAGGLGGSSLGVPESDPEVEGPRARGLGQSSFGIPESGEQGEEGHGPEPRGLGASSFGAPASDQEGEDGEGPSARGLDSVGGFDSFAEPGGPGAPRGLGDQGSLSGGGVGGGGAVACDLRDVKLFDDENVPSDSLPPELLEGARQSLCLYSSGGLGAGCSEQGGVALSACPTGAIARCVFAAGGVELSAYYYPQEGVANDAVLAGLAIGCEGTEGGGFEEL